MYAHLIRYTYALYAHTHTTYMHARVYKCTHCDRKVHLARFYFDRINSINFVNKNAWIPYDANPRGPKKIYVSKFSPLVFDGDVSSHKMWEGWCLGGRCMS